MLEVSTQKRSHDFGIRWEEIAIYKQPEPKLEA